MNKAALKEHLIHLLLAVLLSAGISLPVFALLDLLSFSVSCLFVIAGASVLLESFSLHKWTSLGGTALIVTSMTVWLLAGNGVSLVTDLWNAVSLHLSGRPEALPLVSREAAFMLSLLISVFCFFAAGKSAGCFPALLLVMGIFLLLWLKDESAFSVYLIPAVISSFCLFVKDRHPEASFGRIFPWAILMVLAVFLLTPAGGLVYPPLKEKADKFRQNMMDRLFFTQPRNVFSLASEGFYPEGSSQLGGSARPTDHPVMQVSSPSPVYLRGAVLNEYDGHVWKNTLGGRRYLWQSIRKNDLRDTLFDTALPEGSLAGSMPAPVSVSVRMLSPGTSTLFLPQRLKSLRTGGDMIPYFSNSSEIFITRDLKAGDTWSADAVLLKAGDAGLEMLIRASSRSDDPGWESVLETYTRLPDHLEEPVRAMADEITQGISDPYTKAIALQNELKRMYRYSLEIGDQPVNVDFVTHFLFQTKEGYCTHFASAMAVLSRMAGLPARYVEGYLAWPDENGDALVTGLDAHAWTEIYFKGFGWVTFDATPGQSRRSGGGSSRDDSSSGRTEQPSPEPSREPDPEPSQTPSPEPAETPSPSPDRPSDGNQSREESVRDPSPSPTPEPSVDPGIPEDRPSPIPSPESARVPEYSMNSSHLPAAFWIAVAIILLILCIAIRWFITSPAFRDRFAANEIASFEIWLQETDRRLYSMKLARGNGETPLAFARRLDREGLLPLELDSLGESVSRFRYGKYVPSADDLTMAKDCAASLKRGMNLSSRLRYVFIRLFISSRHYEKRYQSL